uniref:Transposase Tc1-like domain-containing protein n=1 Tax=Magallana gigas TaxID=29159 RepID=A0A8W8LKA6_MAGGI
MWMSNTSNPELTAQCILRKLEKQCCVQVSKEYVCALRRRLNWSAKHTKYGQLISHKNVRLRCDWCFQQLISKDTYPNVFYVDESTVEMCSSGRLVFHQHGSNLDRLPAKSPKPKHSYKFPDGLRLYQDNDRKHTSNQQNSGWRKRGFLKM